MCLKHLPSIHYIKCSVWVEETLMMITPTIWILQVMKERLAVLGRLNFDTYEVTCH